MCFVFLIYILTVICLMSFFIGLAIARVSLFYDLNDYMYKLAGIYLQNSSRTQDKPLVKAVFFFRSKI